MGTKTLVDVRDEIMGHLKSIERTLSWLARKTNLNYATLYSCFVQKTFNLSQDNLNKINRVLKTDYTL